VRIYLDHNATAPLRPEVHAALLDFLGPPANPSSAHREGARARAGLETARAEVASLVGGVPAEIVFTSGATEANNLALRGTLAAAGPGPDSSRALSNMPPCSRRRAPSPPTGDRSPSSPSTPKGGWRPGT